MQNGVFPKTVGQEPNHNYKVTSERRPAPGNVVQMNRLLVIYDSIRRRGLRRTFKKTLSFCVDFFFDIRYGTDTFTWVDLDKMGIDGERKAHSIPYSPTHALTLRMLLRKLALPQGKIFVDLGCGKGKVLLIASEFPFREVRGVEVSPVLYDIAIRNCDLFKSKGRGNSPCKVILSDAAEYQIGDDEDVFYIFNPFDDLVLKEVMENISSSLVKKARKIWIVYRNAVHREIIEANQIFSLEKVFDFWGQDFFVYSNRHPEPNGRRPDPGQ